MCSRGNLFTYFTLLVALLPQTLRWWVNHWYLSQISGRGSCSLLAASPEIISLNISGFRLTLRFGERTCNRKNTYYSKNTCFRSDKPKPFYKSLLSVILPGTHSASTCRGPAHILCNSALAPGAKEILPYVSPSHSSFPSPGSISQHDVYISESLVWRPQPSIHTGLASPVVPVQECQLPVTFSRPFPRSGPLLTASKIV